MAWLHWHHWQLHIPHALQVDQVIHVDLEKRFLVCPHLCLFLVLFLRNPC